MNDAICQEIQRALFVRWREVDGNAGVHTHELYEAEGEFRLGDRVFQGREEIRRFYAWRRSGQPRTTRHLVLNPIMDCSPDMVTVDYTLVIFGGAGNAPIETAPPNMVADAAAQLVRHGDRWLFRRHCLAPVMVGGSSIQIPDVLPA